MYVLYSNMLCDKLSSKRKPAPYSILSNIGQHFPPPPQTPHLPYTLTGWLTSCISAPTQMKRLMAIAIAYDFKLAGIDRTDKNFASQLLILVGRWGFNFLTERRARQKCKKYFLLNTNYKKKPIKIKQNKPQ